MPSGSESSSGHSDSESSVEIEAPPRKKRKLNQKKGRKSTKTPIQRLNAERKKWCQLKERKQTAIDKLKKKQKRAMKKVVDEHKREMKEVKDDHNKKITKQRGKMESIMKEIEEDSDVTDDVELCRFCALVHELGGEEEEWKQCSGDKCENISCEDCSTECSRCNEKIYCHDCRKRWIVQMKCGAVICLLCTDYHYKDRCGISRCKDSKYLYKDSD